MGLCGFWNIIHEMASQFFFGVVFILTFLVCFYWQWTRSRFVRLINALPGRKYLPVLGNLLDFIHLDPEGLFMTLLHEPRRYGDICRVWLLNRPFVLISSPELMKPILASPRLITKSKEYRFFKPLTSEGLFDSTGERWKNRRSLLNPAFHSKILQGSYMNTFNKISIDYTNQLGKTITENQINQVDIAPFIANLTMDSIIENLLGHPTKDSEEKTKVIFAFEKFDNNFTRRIFNPLISFDSIFWATLLGRSTTKCLNTINRFTGQLIKNQRDAIKAELKEAGNISIKDEGSKAKNKLLLLMDILLNNSGSDRGKLTEQEIQGEVNIFLQGFLTTASALTWFLYCLSRHPEEQDLVLNELDQVYADDKNRPCTSQDLSELKYLECCIKEALRLYPSVPNITRHLTEDVVVGNYTLPAGATVALSIYGMHRNPKVFPDPDSFKPQRFLPENSEGRHPYAFIPFSAGPRNCIGSKYSMIQMKTALSHLLRNFRFASLEKSSTPMMEPHLSFVFIRPKVEVNLIVTKRGV